jgi:hypothetical protein
VVHAVIVRVSYDARYLAFRRATNRRTGYNAPVQQDMRALSLAALWLEEVSIDRARAAESTLAQGEGRHECRDGPEEQQR